MARSPRKSSSDSASAEVPLHSGNPNLRLDAPRVSCGEDGPETADSKSRRLVRVAAHLWQQGYSPSFCFEAAARIEYPSQPDVSHLSQQLLHEAREMIARDPLRYPELSSQAYQLSVSKILEIISQYYTDSDLQSYLEVLRRRGYRIVSPDY